MDHRRTKPVPLRVVHLDPAQLLGAGVAGTDVKVARRLADCAVVLVRPDRYVAYALSRIDLAADPLDDAKADAICARVAGWDADRSKVALSRANNAWLTDRFHDAMFPLRFIHTAAVVCFNQTKEDAVAAVKAKNFTAENKLDALNDTGTNVIEDDALKNLTAKPNA